MTYELADTLKKRENGLMFRDRLPPNHSMLFVFPGKQEQCCFWMKNTYISLDIAFIDEDFKIIEIISREPQSEELSCISAVRYVLETNKGWFQDHAVKKGANMRIFKSILLEKRDKVW